MNNLLLDSKIQEFIRAHENDDERKLVLSQRTILGVPSSLIAEQISARRRAKLKLPAWYRTEGILYPATLNMEQCSSEATAHFKVAFIKRMEQKLQSGADLTGGLGVDSFFLSTLFSEFNYVEPDGNLLRLAQNNLLALGTLNIIYHQSTAENFVSTSKQSYDLLYLDPSRRDKNVKKVFQLKDCEPNVSTLQKDLFRLSNHILIKTSPLLDIQQALTELPFVKRIAVVSVSNECKELLFYQEKDFDGEATVEAVNLNFSGDVVESFSFTLSEERKAKSSFGNPSVYLYEPNASLLKSGAFRLVGERYQLYKIHINTHLYTHDQLFIGFPGRIFEILHLQPDFKKISDYFPDRKANIITRNYPLKPEQLKKKLKLEDGGDHLIGFSGNAKKYLVVARRVK